jgi:dCMP deaminase
MEIADKVAERTTCNRRSVGAVIVKDKRILATGYNGAPSGVAHCLGRGCLREQLHIPSGQRQELCRGAHAEQNAVIQAARYGTPIAGSQIYCTTFPCSMCAKILINAGITEIVYRHGYPDDLSRDLLSEAGIVLRQFGEEE